MKLIFEDVFNDIVYSEMCGELGTKEGALAFYYKNANRLTLYRTASKMIDAIKVRDSISEIKVRLSSPFLRSQLMTASDP